MRSATATQTNLVTDTGNDVDFIPHNFPPAIKAGVRLFFILFWVLILIGPLWLSYVLKKQNWRNRIMQFGSRMLLVSMGAKVQVSGSLSDKRPLLLVTNHLSYLDVCILNACVDVKFTPKSDILKWPLFGSITKFSGAITVDRKPEKIHETRAVMKEQLDKGEVICLFPEATTGDGLTMKPFKPAFFSLCEESFGQDEQETLYVQPAAIIYRTIGGLPIDSYQWPKVAWYGDMDLAPHLWALLMLPRIEVEVAFLPVLDTHKKTSRKSLAHQAESTIAKTIEASRQKIRSVQSAAPSAQFMPKRLLKSN